MAKLKKGITMNRPEEWAFSACDNIECPFSACNGGSGEVRPSFHNTEKTLCEPCAEYEGWF